MNVNVHYKNILTVIAMYDSGSMSKLSLKINDLGD